MVGTKLARKLRLGFGRGGNYGLRVFADEVGGKKKTKWDRYKKYLWNLEVSSRTAVWFSPGRVLGLNFQLSIHIPYVTDAAAVQYNVVNSFMQ